MREVLGLRELGGEDDESGEVGARDEEVAAGEAVGPGDEPADGAVAVGARGWRVRAAAGVVIALFVGVGYMLTLGRPPAVERPSIVEGPAASAAPAAQAASAAAAQVGESVEDAARAALDAWARFADSGDVDQLETVFDPGGPQFARLRAEAAEVAARPAAGAPYAFTAIGMQVGAGGSADERVVVADVVVSRVGETDQRFAWELVMRRGEGRWRLWTVRERASGP